LVHNSKDQAIVGGTTHAVTARMSPIALVTLGVLPHGLRSKKATTVC